MLNSMPQIDRFCVRCRSQISEKRVARGSCFCSDECRRQDKIERRRARAHKYCRLCHRGLPRQKTAQSAKPIAPVEITACAPGAHPSPLGEGGLGFESFHKTQIQHTAP